MAAIIFLAILVRRPFNSNSGVDEAFYLVVGRQWLNGTPPYAGTFDVKPPLLFLLMAAAEALFGFTLWAAKALATAAVATTACGLYLFGRRFTGELAGAAAAILYIVSALTLGGTFSPAELIMAPFTTFGMLTGLAAVFGRSRSELPTLLLSGLLFGAAACVKQTALFEAAALGAALALSRQGGARLRAFGAFATGLGAVPIGFAMYFLAIGHLGDLINDAGISAIRRAGAGYLPWGKAFELLLIGTLAVLPAVSMAGILWAKRRPLRCHPVYPSIRFLAVWAAGTLLGVLATKAMFVIYTLPLLQPLCLASGAFIEHVLGRVKSHERRLVWRIGALGAAVLYSCWVVSPLFWAGGSSVKAAEAAAALMLREGKRAGDRILVVDRDIPVYLTSGAEPPHSIFHPQQLLCDFPRPGAGAALAESMESNPAFVIVADPPAIRICEQHSRRAAIDARLARDYRALGHFQSSVTGWPGSFTVFSIKERAGGSSACRESASLR
ncbi:MAG: ArnT family glycosyltransferase [Rhodomicrobium sp.]